MWTVNVKGAPRRVEHAAVVVNDKIFLLGGFCETDVDFEKPIVVNVLDPDYYRWSVVPHSKSVVGNSRTPYLLHGHSAVVYGEKIYVWGGRNFMTDCNELLCFDTVTMQWSRPTVSGTIPDPRYAHTACVIDNCMYVYGGQNSNYSLVGEVHCLDLLSLSWKRIHIQGDSPPSLSFSASFPIGKRMYIYGGIKGTHPETYYEDVVYFDTSSRRWHKSRACGTKPRPRGKYSIFLYSGFMYVFGGYNAESGEHFNDLHRFNLDKCEWEVVHPLGEIPKARNRHSSLVVGDKVFIFGGTSCFPFSSVAAGASAMVLFHHNDLHILDMRPSLRTLCLRVVMAYKLDTSILPENLKSEISLLSPHKIFVIHV